MNYSYLTGLPPQQISDSKKTAKWAKSHLDWADHQITAPGSAVRTSSYSKRINYDLINGKLHMKDLVNVLNTDDLFDIDNIQPIQHYPIMNGYLQVLRGEELARVFDWSVVITNPNVISEMEQAKVQEIVKRLEQLVSDPNLSQEEYQNKVSELQRYYKYSYKDFREIRANALLNHYNKEQNFSLTFNKGFMDGMIVGEEGYLCDIIGGEPTIIKLDPEKTDVYGSGYSTRFEDADIIVLKDYWSLGQIVDTFYDVLSTKDIQQLSGDCNRNNNDLFQTDSDESFIYRGLTNESDLNNNSQYFFDPFNVQDNIYTDFSSPQDANGNIRVLRMFWKSKRRIKKVTSFDQETGEEVVGFYPDNYIENSDLGETSENLWINQAWEGTKLGKDIYVNLRPRPIQYNRLSNPSRCHFGIIGGTYSINSDKPFSLVDIMKPYSYLYDVVNNRFLELLSRNLGTLINIDLAKKPKGWDISKILYYAKRNGVFVTNSFNSGDVGASTGVLAGALNNASQPLISSQLGNDLQFQASLLDIIEHKMARAVGINEQRLGQIANRETVGGVERATLQSAHITQYLFAIHDDIKKRTLEAFLETAKIALKGKSKKFQYILPDHSMVLIDIDGDEFSECDYGVTVDNSSDIQSLKQNLGQLAQAALQNNMIDFSTVIKMYNSGSISEKERMIEEAESSFRQQQQQQAQEQNKIAQEEIQAKKDLEMQKLNLQKEMNELDNQTRLEIAKMQIDSKVYHDDQEAYIKMQEQSYAEMNDISRDELTERERQFNENHALEREKFEFEKRKHSEDNKLKDTISKRQVAKANKTSK